MKIVFLPGWPLRYARVVVKGLRTEHVQNGTICLWADDDPAQLAGRELPALWARLDDWAQTAQQGFRLTDRALDAWLLFDEQNTYNAELPLGDLVHWATVGTVTKMEAVKRGGYLFLEQAENRRRFRSEETLLNGAFYLTRNIEPPPRTLDDIRAALTHRQVTLLRHGLEARASVELAEPSGGYDFVVFAWPRYGDEHDAVVVCFADRGESLQASATSATPNDVNARQRRAGADADVLQNKTVLIAGLGSVGGHVAVALASSGVGKVVLHDGDTLKSGNLVRHVCPEYLVGCPKTQGVSVVINDHAPWTKVVLRDQLPHGRRTDLAADLDGADLVVDCTGIFSLSAALAEVCQTRDIPLIAGALYHQGKLARVQRQAPGDTPIAARPADPAYADLPTENEAAPRVGFLELGCTAPINETPPVAVLAIAADVSDAALDLLAGRRHRSDERIIVFRPLQPPFERVGSFDATGRAAGRLL